MLRWMKLIRKKHSRRIAVDTERVMALLDRTMVKESLFLDNGLTMRELARRAGTNRTYVSQVMKVAGVSFYDYVNGFKLRYLAEHAVEFYELKITAEEIAEKCGFSNARSMNKCVKKEYGVSSMRFIKEKFLNMNNLE